MTGDLRRRRPPLLFTRMPLALPTDFDDFSEAAHQDARGFRAFATEWWHFDWHDWPSLPVVR